MAPEYSACLWNTALNKSQYKVEVACKCRTESGKEDPERIDAEKEGTEERNGLGGYFLQRKSNEE